MQQFKRIFLLILDSVGVGEAPDAADFDDVGADTIGHIADYMEGLKMPTMKQLGLGNIRPIKGIEEVEKPTAHYTKMEEASVGKDTMTGHWELMGLHIDQPFQTFPNGFPDELLSDLKERTGRGILGNKPASGTEIKIGRAHV